MECAAARRVLCVYFRPSFQQYSAVLHVSSHRRYVKQCFPFFLRAMGQYIGTRFPTVLNEFLYYKIVLSLQRNLEGVHPLVVRSVWILALGEQQVDNFVQLQRHGEGNWGLRFCLHNAHAEIRFHGRWQAVFGAFYLGVLRRLLVDYVSRRYAVEEGVESCRRQLGNFLQTCFVQYIVYFLVSIHKYSDQA